jgi:hypothetical protein
MINTTNLKGSFYYGGRMTKKVIIEILLVPESIEKKTDEIEREILDEFNEGFLGIPWSYKVEKIRVVDTTIPLKQKTRRRSF